ncbi:hypothetical protein Syun_006483 [Stephania yunnanensis]|uniref:Uncharacterized protein n=1 Tax=Stephania yunnanensis TaxID=152371 RepID=A0AAP0KYB9_9MAGN
MYDGTKSPGPIKESWTHGGIKSPTHIYYIMMIGQQGEVMINETTESLCMQKLIFLCFTTLETL